MNKKCTFYAIFFLISINYELLSPPTYYSANNVPSGNYLIQAASSGVLTSPASFKNPTNGGWVTTPPVALAKIVKQNTGLSSEFLTLTTTTNLAIAGVTGPFTPPYSSLATYAFVPIYQLTEVPAGRYWVRYTDGTALYYFVPNGNSGNYMIGKPLTSNVIVDLNNLGTRIVKSMDGTILPSTLFPTQTSFMPDTSDPTATTIPAGYVAPSTTMANGLYYLINAPNNVPASPLQFITMPGLVLQTGTTTNPPAGAMWNITTSTTGITLRSVYSETYLPNIAITSAPLVGVLFYPVPPVPAGHFTPLTVATGNYYLKSAPNNTPTSNFYIASSNSFVTGAAGSNLYVTKTSTGLTIVDSATGTSVGTYTSATYYTAPLVNALFVPAPVADPGSIALNNALSTAQNSLNPYMAFIDDARAKLQAARTTLTSIAASIPGSSITLPW